MEWAISRNGNYLRKNSKPVFTIFADEDIPIGAENPNGGEKSQDNEFRSILQFPKDGKATYVTWEQAIENLKFYTTELKQSFFTQLQLPDLSYENLKTTPMSGEAMKQMFVDGNLKVTDESGIILEFLDREINVVKAFAKIIDPSLASAIDSLKVQSKITPFSINSFDDKVTTLTTATGGKAVMSQKEAIQELGHSDDADATMAQIAKEEVEDGINIAE
ncbi:MAG: phage portal protein, partial [Bacteroides sp.]|nr:phage portal protein [Bacteroides sp.]